MIETDPERAFAYPFGYASRSFLLIDEEAWTVQDERQATPRAPDRTRWASSAAAIDRGPRETAALLAERGIDPRTVAPERRIALVASGSNGSPSRLAEKLFSESNVSGGDRALIAWRARLRHFDCVYSAHMTTYGSVPATLWPSPGTEIDTIVLLVTEAQLDRLDQTEALGINYERRSSAMELELSGGARLDTAEAYLSIRGALDIRHPGNPARRATPLAAISGRRRRAQALHQHQVLHYVFSSYRHTHAERPRDLLTMLKGLIEDRSRRSRLNATLSRDRVWH